MLYDSSKVPGSVEKSMKTASKDSSLMLSFFANLIFISYGSPSNAYSRESPRSTSIEILSGKGSILYMMGGGSLLITCAF